MTREEVEEEIRKALERLHIPQADFALPDVSPDDGTPSVEGKGPGFTWVIFENGVERDRRVVEGMEIVFLTLKRITGKIVRDLEEQTRSPKKVGLWKRLTTQSGEYGAGLDDYSRWTWMGAHIRIMEYIHRGWGKRMHLHYDMMLKRYPLTAEERLNARELDLSVWLGEN